MSMASQANKLKKGKRMSILLTVLLVVCLLIMWVRGALNSYQPEAVEILEISGPECPAIGPDSPVKVLSWNIGFAGMSAEMDFFADGGQSKRASSAQQVEKNYQAVVKHLETVEAAVMLLQEMPRASFVTRGIDVLEEIRSDIASYRFVFSPTVQIPSLPLAGYLVFGKSTCSTWDLQEGRRLALPTTRDLPTVTIQHFNILETRLPVEGCSWQWVLLNIHLAAFDDGPLRQQQLQQVIDLMEKEFKAGNRVVAGGDWNMLLAETDFPYSTPEKNLFWVKPLPEGVVPENWQWGVDESTPTCRTLEQPYKPGVNYTCVIDGFLVSPNVEILATKTGDLGFANSDHNPVVMTVRSR